MVTVNLLAARFDPQPRTLDQVEEPVDRAEVLRYLGYPQGFAPRASLADAIDRWIGQARGLAAPRATYRILPVTNKSRRWLRVAAGATVTEFKGAIGEFLGSALALAVFVATAGPRLERRASELLRQREDLGAMVLNAVGAERAEAAEAAILAQLRDLARPAGLAPTLPYSPGYCGMALVEQRKLFSLFAGQNLGVTLTHECQMQPVKSVSGLIGLGRAEDVAAFGSPCDRCELYTCNMRR